MNLTLYTALLIGHVLGATVWTGGHLVLACTVLPRACRDGATQRLLEFESNYERIGLPALFVQVGTGLALAWLRLGPPSAWLVSNPLAHVVQLKLALLAATALLAVHARLFLLPKLTPERLPTLAWHIVPVTLLSVGFAVAGVMFRVGGF